MSLYKRGGAAAMAIVVAAFVATGCGPEGGSGASEAASDSPALDLVPKDAVGYATVDLDFDGEQWQQFNEHAKAFDADFEGVEQEVSRQLGSSDESQGGVDYEQDVKPWLGGSGGIAVRSLPADGEARADAEGDGPSGATAEDGDAFAWVELEDRAAFETFAEDQGLEEGEKIGDWSTLSDPDDDTTHMAYDDEIVVFTDSRERLQDVVEYDGDSIQDAEGVDDALGELEGDALMTVVVSGEGFTKAVEGAPQLSGLRNSRQVQDLQGMALAVSAEDDGMRLDGFVKSEREDGKENVEHATFRSLPRNTVFAVGGRDFGGGIQRLAEDAGRENAQVQQNIGAATAALGVDLDDLAEALDGEFAIGMSSEDEGLGALAGSVAGAAMGGSIENVDPGQVARTAAIVLAFEETGDTGETLERITSASAGLAGARSEPEEGTAGDFDTKRSTVGGFPVTTATSDDVAAVTFGVDVFETWGDEPLADNESFDEAWSTADAPDKSASVLWFDAGRVADLAGVRGEEGADVGGLVGWSEADGSDSRLGMFLHVKHG